MTELSIAHAINPVSLDVQDRGCSQPPYTIDNMTNRLGLASSALASATRPLCLCSAQVARVAFALIALHALAVAGRPDGPLCPNGATPSTLVQTACYPSDCSITKQLDWGVPIPETLSIPKFDPSLGTLLSVEVIQKLRFNGELCIDNTQSACGFVNLAPRVQTFTTADSNNAPPITGLSTWIMDEVVDVLGPGFIIGGSDGVNDCVTPSGPPSIGDCTAGEDHVIERWDVSFSQPGITLVGQDIVPWVADSTGATADFTCMAFGLFNGGGTTSMDFIIRSYAGLTLEVRYTYCSQSLGTSLHIPCVRSLGISYCDCTTSGPCGNHGAPDEGCANSTGKGARLVASGSASLSAADLTLRGSQLPAQKPALFFQGVGPEGGGAGIPFGDGLRCVAGSIVRIQIAVSNLAGEVASSIDLAATSNAAPGERRYYQLWFREPPGTGCGSTFNSSNGLVLTWQP